MEGAHSGKDAGGGRKDSKTKTDESEIKESQLMFDSVWNKLKAKYTEERMIFPKGMHRDSRC